jgi:hypothetical protein
MYNKFRWYKMKNIWKINVISLIIFSIKILFDMLWVILHVINTNGNIIIYDIVILSNIYAIISLFILACYPFACVTSIIGLIFAIKHRKTKYICINLFMLFILSPIYLYLSYLFQFINTPNLMDLETINWVNNRLLK